MGLLDSVIGAVMSSPQAQGGIQALVGQLLANDGPLGGLAGLQQKAQAAGLGDVVASWIGKGENLPVSAQQIQQLLGSDVVRNLASSLGIDAQQAAGTLAQALPGLVDQLTPDGTAPAGGLGNANDLLGVLGGLLAKR